MSKGSHPREEAVEVGGKVFNAIEHLCERVTICGSIRRKRPVVGDVDIVIATSQGKQVFDVFYGLGIGERGNAKVLAHVVIDGVSVDLWIVPLESWGAATAFATGPAEENVRLRVEAKKNGWKLSQYGLFDSFGHAVAGETEQGIYEALGLPFVVPEQRDVACGRKTESQNADEIRRATIAEAESLPEKSGVVAPRTRQNALFGAA